MSVMVRHHLGRHQRASQRSMERLATGKRINSASDDPAGLIVATRLKSAIRSARVEEEMLRRADAMANIADAHIAQLSDMMDDLRRVVIQGSNTGALSESEIAANQFEIDQIVQSLERFAADASDSLGRFNMPDGANALVASQIQTVLSQVKVLASGGSADLKSGNFDAAEEALDAATTSISTARARVGAYQKYNLQSRRNILLTQITNLEAARSTIEDTDYAEEISNLTRSQLLTEVSIWVLRKINDIQSKSILALLA